MSKNFARQNLRGKSFKGQDLTGADFSGADIRGTNFKRATLVGAKFRGAKAGKTYPTQIILIIFSLFLAGVIAFFAIILGFWFFRVLDWTAVSANVFYYDHKMRFIVILVILAIFFSIVAVGIQRGKGILTLITTAIVIASSTVMIAVIGSEAISEAVNEVITVAVSGAITNAITEAEIASRTSPRAIAGAGVVAIMVLFLTFYIIRRILYKEDEQFARLRTFAIAFNSFGGTNFKGADLTEADFSGTMLKNARFTKVTIIHTCWLNAQGLKFTHVAGTILENRMVRELLVTGQGKNTDFSKSDLTNANLQGADLRNADLTEAILIGATLEGANLSGACLQAWNIDSTTQLEGAYADYVYLKANQQERRPSDPKANFGEGEFSKLFQKVLDTVDLIFRNGIDWQAFIVSFDELREKIRIESEGAEISVQSIENKGDGVFVVKVNVPSEVNKGEIEREFKLKYEEQEKITERQYQELLETKQELLEAKNKIIDVYEKSTDIQKGIIDILAQTQEQKKVDLYKQLNPNTQFPDEKPPVEKSTQSFHSVINPNQKDDNMANQPSTDVVIITALKKEQDAVLRYLDSPEKVQTKNRVVYKSNLRHENSDSFYQIILLCLEAMGNVQAALATTQAIDIWNPDMIILTGIMGGIAKDNERYLGDLIAAEQIVGYEMGKVTDAGIERRYEVLRPAYAFITAARNFPLEKWALAPTIPRPDDPDGRIIPKIHWGVVASGEKVIADSKTGTELQNHWLKLTGIEMEGYGTALAAYTAESRPGFFMVKGICDWANPDKNDDWQAYAADVAAVYVVNLLKTKPFSSQFDKHQAQIKVPLHYAGKIKIQLCRQLGIDWQDLADYFDIPAHRRAQFPQGRECQAIWQWLEERNRLYSLKEALNFLERPDLVELLSTEQ